MIRDVPGNEAIIELINTPQFKATNPQKAKNLLKSKYHSFSGRTDCMLSPFSHSNYIQNNKSLEEYVKNLGDGKFMHNRAWIFKNVDANQFLYFFEGLNFDKSAMNVNPTTFCNYLKEWSKDDNSPDLPKIHIGISGWNEDKKDKPRKRQRRLNVKKPSNKDEMIKEATNFLTTFEGSNNRPREYFTRDRFMDKDKDYHIKSRKNKRLKKL